jgi:geranylgeranyl diphosphate synthase type II
MKTTATAIFTPQVSKEMIDDLLTPLIAERVQQAKAISPHYETLWQSIEALYGAGGKRLRSYMTLLVYRALSDKPLEDAAPAAAAQELLHLAMLIHDDIIDRDLIRYGIKNVTGQYVDSYEELLESTQDRRHYAESMAILAGDLLISDAYLLIGQTRADATTILEVQRLLATAVFRVIGGELLDTEAAFRGKAGADPIVIAQEKTASYTFVTPFLTGATLAGASTKQLEQLRTLGEDLGIAYQLRDDVIGVFGDESVTGKSSDGDLKEGKRTMLIDEFHRLATPSQAEEFDSLFGRADTPPAGIVRLRELLKTSGALQSIEDRIDSYKVKVLAQLDALNFSPEYHQAFHDLIERCLRREA